MSNWNCISTCEKPLHLRGVDVSGGGYIFDVTSEPDAFGFRLVGTEWPRGGKSG
jgi:hypothetical protein